MLIHSLELSACVDDGKFMGLFHGNEELEVSIESGERLRRQLVDELGTLETVLTVDYYHVSSIQGSRDSLGVPLEPSTVEHVVIEGVYDDRGNDVELSDATLDTLAGVCLEIFKNS